MAESMEFKGSTVEDAIATGLVEMNLAREDAVVEVLDKGGFLKKAKVAISKKPTDGEIAVDFVRHIAAFLDADCTYDLTETEDKIEIRVEGEHAGKLIGYRGDVLDAVQYIASVLVNRDKKQFTRLSIDCENYREKREEVLKALAAKLADKAVRTGKKMRLEPMNPAERRVIHASLQGNEEVETFSQGTEPNRFLTIVPKNLKRDRPYRDERRDGDRPYSRDRQEGGRGGYNRDKREGNRDGRGFRDRDGRGGARPPQKRASMGFGSYLGNTRSGYESEVIRRRQEEFRENNTVAPETKDEE